MANESILTTDSPKTIDNPIYLERDNYLSEYEGSEKEIVRSNLGTYGTSEVYNKDETKRLIVTSINEELNRQFAENNYIVRYEDVDSIVSETLDNYYDQETVDNLLSEAKTYARNQVNLHIGSSDPHPIIIDKVVELLNEYAKNRDVYTKEDVYNKGEIDKKNKEFLKKDSAIFFKELPSGGTPVRDSQFANKRYVDDSIYQHLISVDPHGFTTILNNRLQDYIKRKEVYDKTQTYSRSQIDSIINKTVESVVNLSIEEYINSINERLEYIRNQHYVKSDGSVSFNAPQRGKAAVENDQLTTFKQVKDLVEATNTELSEQIKSKECEWITDGPIQATVGHMEDNSPVPSTMTLQEVCDAIFYGQGISISAPELGVFNEPVDVTICLQGSSAKIDYGELFQNGQLIATISREDFKDSICITIKSNPITEDTEFVFKAYYLNGSSHSVSATTKVAMPVFIGIIPYHRFGDTLSYQDLLDLYFADSVNNKFYDKDIKLSEIEQNFNFVEDSEYKFIVALPENYPDLFQMKTASQQFSRDAFNTVTALPLHLPNTENAIIYKYFIYKQPITQCTIPVTFIFK